MKFFIYKSQHPQGTLTELSLCMRYFFCMVSAYRRKEKAGHFLFENLRIQEPNHREAEKNAGGYGIRRRYVLI